MKDSILLIDIHTHTHLVGGFKYVLFHPYLGKIPILTNIFQGVETTNETHIFECVF